MSIPNDRRYAESHEWAMAEDSVAVGITDYAQEQLGDIVFVELPTVGERVEKGAAMAVVESVKAVSSLYAPVSGEIVAINDELEGAPELLNEDAYGTWIVRISADDPAEMDSLLDAQGYEKVIA